jgi:hypothetical protein
MAREDGRIHALELTAKTTEEASWMLKKLLNVVLGSSKSSTYPRGYASGFDSPAALLDGLFEHPVRFFRCATFADHRSSRVPT